LIFNLLTLDEIDINRVLDEIWATKSCKAAIKAWKKLSYLEMKKLIEDWFEYISWQFVCQHWRPSFVKIPKEDIEKLFDR
jgi:DNA mismatch repair protein MutL